MPRTCVDCGIVLDHDRHRFYELDGAGREQLAGQYCDIHCPRCFRSTTAEAAG